MDDVVVVHVLTSSEELDHVEASLFVQASSSCPNHVVHALEGAGNVSQSGTEDGNAISRTHPIRAELQLEVHVGFVLEEVVELDDVGVRQGPVDENLGEDLADVKRISIGCIFFASLSTHLLSIFASVDERLFHDCFECHWLAIWTLHLVNSSKAPLRSSKIAKRQSVDAQRCRAMSCLPGLAVGL